MDRKPDRTPSRRAVPDAQPDLFRLLVEGVRDYAIFMLDPDGRVVSWNPGAERIKGYTAAEIIGRHFSVFYPPEDVRAGKPSRAPPRRDRARELRGGRLARPPRWHALPRRAWC